LNPNGQKLGCSSGNRMGLGELQAILEGLSRRFSKSEGSWALSAG
jgi:hypothetical protein